MPFTSTVCRSLRALVVAGGASLVVACAAPLPVAGHAEPGSALPTGGRPPVPALPDAAPGMPQDAGAGHAPAAPGDLAPSAVSAATGIGPAHSALAAPTPDRFIDKGLASWYGERFHGRRTASGERYDMHGLTAAHKTLPFGTLVRVRSVATGKEVVVRINDRGPYRHQRIIDLSQGAITVLGLRHRGVTAVELFKQ